MSQINYSNQPFSATVRNKNQGFIFNQDSTDEWQKQNENGLEIIKAILKTRKNLFPVLHQLN